MSKILEALQRPHGQETGKPRRAESGMSRSSISAKEVRQMTQEQLADVYFQRSGKVQELPAPTIIRVSEKERSFFLPWVITLLALTVTVFSLFSTKRIAIDIRVLEDKVPQSEVSRSLEPVREAAPLPTQPEPVYVTTAPVRSIPEVVSLSPLDFNFAGASVLNSSRDRKQMTLANSSLSGLGYAAINFEAPFPGSRYVLSFDARGRAGGEQLELIFKDIFGNSNLNWKAVIPFPDGLKTEWQTATVKLEETEYFHADAIKQMRIEVGTQRTKNVSDAMIFLRNMQWLPLDLGAYEQSTAEGEDVYSLDFVEPSGEIAP